MITVKKFIQPSSSNNACACLRSIFLGIFLFCFYPVTDVFSQTTLVVSSQAWSGLNQAEREIIQSKHIVQAIGSESFGVIIDAQGIDRSTPGNTAGSNLGQALGSATYIDRSLSSGNYSARNHLGAMILGSVIGSTLDSQRVESYHFRYAIRLGTGSIAYHDVISNTPFRHPLGVCVIVPQVALATDQGLCTLTTDVLKRIYIGLTPTTLPEGMRLSNRELTINEVKSVPPILPVQDVSDNQANVNLEVNCRIGVLPPVRTTRAKCQTIQGVFE